MAKYVCPLCGAIWYDTEDLAACVAKDSKNIKKMEEATKMQEAKLEAANTLAAARKEVDAAYADLKRKVQNYNTAAQVYRKYDGTVSTCNISLSYTNEKTVEAKKACDYSCKSNVNNYKKPDLDKLINDIFGF